MSQILSAFYSRLKAIKKTDLEGIAAIVLKNCSVSLSSPLCQIFSKSLSLGQFLDQWKFSKITPTYKSGCKQNITNYRPICKLPVVTNIFEKIVSNKILTIIKPLQSVVAVFTSFRRLGINTFSLHLRDGCLSHSLLFSLFSSWIFFF